MNNRKKLTRTIDYTPALDIRNTDILARGTGAKYMEVIEAHIPNTYIAVAWRRKLIDTDNILIRF